MSYATAADLTKRFGETELIELTDQEGVGQINESVLAVALADADAEVDSYLVGRAVLPLSSVPPVLVRVSCDIARFRLFGAKAPEEVRNRYQDARAWLKDVAAGRAVLDGVDTPATAPRGPAVVAPDAVFTSDAFGRMPRV
jgi:phage gp36-like protein